MRNDLPARATQPTDYLLNTRHLRTTKSAPSNHKVGTFEPRSRQQSISYPAPNYRLHYGEVLPNHLQYEFGLVPVKIVKEDKAEYIQALLGESEYFLKIKIVIQNIICNFAA